MRGEVGLVLRLVLVPVRRAVGWMLRLPGCWFGAPWARACRTTGKGPTGIEAAVGGRSEGRFGEPAASCFGATRLK